MRIHPGWFVDERSLELVEMYLFYKQNPSLAFPGSLQDQPDLWIQAKIILDNILRPFELN